MATLDEWNNALSALEPVEEDTSLSRWEEALQSLESPTTELMPEEAPDGGDIGLQTIGALGRGLAEGLTTELPGMAGSALEFITPDVIKEKGFDPGKTLSTWAEEKAEEWYGPQDYEGLNRIVYEGSKMFAPSVVPGGLSFAGARSLLKVGKLVKLGKIEEARKAAKLAAKVSSVSVAGMFGLSQAQHTEDAAFQQANVLEAQGRLDEAAEVRAAGEGWAPLITGGIEATGEYYGTKYLAKLFRLDEAQIVKRGAKAFVEDFLKTLGVEVGTEIGQAGTQAMTEKAFAIRPDADPLAEALDVIGPTAFMTLLTGGLGAATNIGRPTEHEGSEKLTPIIEKYRLSGLTDADKDEAIASIEAMDVSDEAKKAGSADIRAWTSETEETEPQVAQPGTIEKPRDGEGAEKKTPLGSPVSKPEGPILDATGKPAKQFDETQVEQFRQGVEKGQLNEEDIRQAIEEIKKNDPEQAAEFEAAYFPADKETGEKPKFSKKIEEKADWDATEDTGESLAKEFGMRYLGGMDGLEYYSMRVGEGKETTVATKGVNRQSLITKIANNEKAFGIKHADLKFSKKADDALKKGYEAASILYNEIKSKLTPRAFKNLLGSGRLKITDNKGVASRGKDTELRYSDDGERIQGFYDPKTKTAYLNFEGLAKGETWGVIMHELGSHAGLKGMLGDQYDPFMAEVERLVSEGDKKITMAQTAAARTEAEVQADIKVEKDPKKLKALRKELETATAEEDVTEEIVSYLSQIFASREDQLRGAIKGTKDPAQKAALKAELKATKQSIPQKIMTAIRAWAFKAGISRKLTSDDMIHLVKGAVMRETKMAGKDIESFKRWAGVAGKAGAKVVKGQEPDKYAKAKGVKVSITAIREKTGKKITVKGVDAVEALSDIESQINTYESIRKCVGA